MGLFIKLMGSLVLILPLATFAGQFDELDVQCKKEKAPSNDMLLNAHQMFLEVREIIKREEAERTAQGRKFDVMIVARAGTDPKKNVLLKDNPTGEEITLKQMYDNANRRKSETRNSKASLKSIVEEMYAEPRGSKRNIGYSHVGLLVRNELDPNGWSFIHLLSPCSSKESRIYHEGIATFFMDDPYAYRAWFMIPTDEIQQRIIDVIDSTTIPETNTVRWTLVPPTYNLTAVLSNPAEANSNTYPVYVLSAAIRNQMGIDYRQANSITRELDFRPSKIILKGMHAMAKSFLAPKYVEIRKSEHPYSGSLGAVSVLTALSIKEFMARQNILDEEFEFRLPPERTFKRK
jgi:hypothetical protein